MLFAKSSLDNGKVGSEPRADGVTLTVSSLLVLSASDKGTARFGVRHFQTMLMAGGSFTIYMLRVNLSVAIVGMTGMDSPSNVTSNATETGQEKARVYDWDETTQGLVLSSFFWGYMITQIPAGVLTQRFGGHRILTWAMFSTSVLSMLLPPCAYLGGWKLVCANRMLQGVTQFGADSPLAHKTISAEERAYIVTSLGGPNLKAPTPWRAILRSSPAWAAIATMALQGGVFLAFLTKIPTYLSTVLKFDIKENGLLTALPYFVSWALSFPFSSTCDWLVKRGSINLTNARKIYNSISHVVGGMAMLALGFCTDTTLSVILLTISIGVMSASYPGVQSNFMDLTPNYSGTIFSISNFLSACCGVAGPIVISWIVSEKVKS
ncbi:hypothetical protein FOCC_FOCC003385 [Frankliniella occidentalis]|nr:hypothetical protein FOCC_FOCC003385 [Frankliniella occidentalis]